MIASQRLIVGSGLAVLLVISSVAIGLDANSRREAITADRIIAVLQRLADLKVAVRAAEAASRGFALTGDPGFADEFAAAREAIAPGFAVALRDVEDPAAQRLLEETRLMAERRLAVSAEMIRTRGSGGESAGAAAGTTVAEARAMAQTIGANLDKVHADNRVRLAKMTAKTRLIGHVVFFINLCGVALILLLAGLLIREAGRARRKLSGELEATRAAAQSLEAAVAERTAHLVAAHEELRLSSGVLQSTFNSMAEAVLVIDRKREVRLWNPATERILGYRPGMDIFALRALANRFHADGVTPISFDELPVERALRGEEFDAVEYILRPESGDAQIHLVASGRPFRDADGAISGAAIVYHDISASRETERKLQQAQKLEAIGKLTGGVAHDFNNMLTVISGTTETLVAGLQDQPELHATAVLIDQAAQRCRELIEHLLAFARRQPLHPRDVDVNAAISDVAKLLRPTLGEQIEIETVLDPNLAPAHVDASQLANAVLNMAINARDAMPNGGRVTVKTRMVELDRRELEINPEEGTGSYLMIAVADTGTGMPAHVRERVFEPFFTTKEVGKGSGLGLSMVYGFVTQCGGHIRIDSEEGRGTTVRLYLPPAAQDAAAKAAPETPPVAGGSETILVVEDDTLVRNLVTAQLIALGYRAVAAADGPAALARLKNDEHFDLLFTDVVMPGGLSGLQLADAAKKIRPGMKVLYTSGYSDDIMHHGQFDPGVLLLQKPYRKAQLAQMVRKALGG